MARPHLQVDERLSDNISVRLTIGEHTHLVGRANAAGLGVGDYVRTALAEAASLQPALGINRLGTVRPKRFGVRLSRPEAHRLRERAKAAGVSVGDFIRHAIVEHSQYEANTGLLRLRLSAETSALLVAEAERRGDSIEKLLTNESLGIASKRRRRRPDAAMVMKLDATKQALDRIGNNINQLARAIHVGREFQFLWKQHAIELAAERRRAAEILEHVASRYGH